MTQAEVGHIGYAPDYESEEKVAPDFLGKMVVRDKRGQVTAEDTPPPVEQPRTPLIAQEQINETARKAVQELEKLELGDRFYVRDVLWEVIDVQADHLKIKVSGFSPAAIKRMKRAIRRK